MFLEYGTTCPLCPPRFPSQRLGLVSHWAAFTRTVLIELAKQLIALIFRDPPFGLLIVSGADVDSDIDCDPAAVSNLAERMKTKASTRWDFVCDVLQARQVKSRPGLNKDNSH